ncbi:MAG: hypothetical protein LBD69_03220, partial [Puniceicoccales bacterium]|nr:hypothetical protein [Puniceicoccales bacterium]
MNNDRILLQKPLEKPLTEGGRKGYTNLAVKTSRPQDLKTSRPQDLKTSRPQDLKTSRPQDLKTSRPQ